MAGDDIDTFEIKGNLSVIASEDPGNVGNGSIDVEGTVNTDSIECNIPLNGLTIYDIKNYTQREVVAPPLPVSGEHTFYIDTVSKKLMSLDTTGVLTTYQPITTKGDLLTHDGTTQIRLPVAGAPNMALLSDPASNSGLKWGVVNTSTDTVPRSTVISLRSNVYSELLPGLKGCFVLLVYNKVSTGGSAIFFVSKSRNNIGGHIVRSNTSSGMVNNALLETQWLSLEELELRKTSTPAGEDGDYQCNFGFNNIEDSFALSGTSWLSIVPDTVGNFVYCINSQETDGPSAIFIATKSNASLNTGNIVRITSSPAVDASVLEARWNSNSALEFRKTSSSYNGDYFYIDILTLEQVQVVEVTLTGTTPVEIIKKYQRASFMVSVYKNDGNVRAIFTITKNDKTRSGSMTRHSFSTNNGTTNLMLLWGVNEGVQLYKTNASYDGLYTVTFL